MNINVHINIIMFLLLLEATCIYMYKKSACVQRTCAKTLGKCLAIL